jgi:hypothetical protein
MNWEVGKAKPYPSSGMTIRANMDTSHCCAQCGKRWACVSEESPLCPNCEKIMAFAKGAK